MEVRASEMAVGLAESPESGLSAAKPPKCGKGGKWRALV